RRLLRSFRRDEASVSSSIAEVFAMLTKQKLIGHPGDVVANNDVPRFRLCKLFVEWGHGAPRVQIVAEKFFEKANRTITIFTDGMVVIYVREEKAFELTVLVGSGFAEACKALWQAANVIRGCNAGSRCPLLRG